MEKRVKTIYDEFLSVIAKDDERAFKELFDDGEFNIHELAKTIIQGTNPISVKYLKFANDLDPDNKYWKDLRIVNAFREYEINDPESKAFKLVLELRGAVTVYEEFLNAIELNDKHSFKELFDNKQFDLLELIKNIIRGTNPINTRFLKYTYDLAPNNDVWKDDRVILAFDGVEKRDKESKAIQHVTKWRGKSKNSCALRGYVRRKLDVDLTTNVVSWKKSA